MSSSSTILSRKASLLPGTSPGRVPELDGLRGVAISLVIVFHYVASAEHRGLNPWLHRALTGFAFGWSGVDLFFILSGFLIGGILLDARSSPTYFRAFYMRRVFRILPLYYAWTLLFAVFVALALWLAPGRFPITTADLARVPVQLLFLQNIFLGWPHAAFIWFAPTWSLAVEEQFYLIAPFLIRYVSLRVLVPILVAVVALTPLVRLAIFLLAGNGVAAMFLMPARADALSCGILVAIAWRQPRFHTWLEKHRIDFRRILLFLAAGFVALLWSLVHPIGFVRITIGFTWLALFFSCLMLFVLKEKQTSFAAAMRWRWLRNLGVISYCVYIIHDPINTIAHHLILHRPPQLENLAGVAVTVISLSITLSIALVSWAYFESPMIRRGHKYSYGTADSAQTATSKVPLTAPGVNLPAAASENPFTIN